jgi:hypothetical protein
LRYPATIIFYRKHFQSALFRLDFDAFRACIDGIFYQLLNQVNFEKNGAYPSQMRASFKKRKHARKEDFLLANLDGISRSLDDFTSGDLIDYILTQLSNWHI